MIRSAFPVRAALAAFAVLLVAIAAQAADDGGRARILELLRDGDRDGALDLARTYGREHPDDATMLYNLACLEAGALQREAALAALRAAAAADPETLDGADTDPDLVSLHDDPGFVALLAEREGRLALLAAEQGAELTQGGEPVVRELIPRDPALTGAADQARVHLAWEPRGLRLDLHLAGVWAGLAAKEAPPPWRGGPGAVVTLAVSDRDDPERSGNFWLFAFGVDTVSPVGALWLPGQQRWQRVGELDPKARYGAAGDLVFTVTLPWSTLMPFHPLVDPEMGFNVAVRAPPPGGGGYLVADLLPDSARFRPGTATRRVAPVFFDPQGVQEEVFLGRLEDSISGAAPLHAELVGLTGDPGRAYLTVDVLDDQRRSVVPGGVRTGGVELDKGLNRLEHDLDFSGLDTGLYLVQATLEFPSGQDAVWSTSVLHLARDWQLDLRTRMAAVAAGDRPTVDYVLGNIVAAVDDHLPRRHPGAVAATLADLSGMLDRAARHGSILPEAGPFLLVAPRTAGEQRVWHGYRPSAPAATRRRPVLVFTDSGGFGHRYTERFDRFMTYDKPTLERPMQAPDLLVPELQWPAVQVGDAPLVEAREALAWARERYGVERVDVAGVGFGAGVALQLAAVEPGSVASLALMLGKDLAPWPQADDAFVTSRLDGLDRTLPVAWYDFDDETRVRSQAQQIRAVLDAMGMTAVVDHGVTGALNPGQAADRIVLWAMEGADSGR